jgi:hypothetical protein
MNEDLMTPLCVLARKYSTDKGGWHYNAGDTCHNYTPAYYNLFKGRENEITRVLEIGVHYGCSVRMWRDFFPNAEIIGLDSNAAALLVEGRIKSFAADQGSAESLKLAMEKVGPGLFDFMVDDGSHEESHQVVSANFFLPYLKPNGYYIIEDIRYDCSPEYLIKQIKLPSAEYTCESIQVGIGLGKAKCDPNCPACKGTKGESLLTFRRS